MTAAAAALVATTGVAVGPVAHAAIPVPEPISAVVGAREATFDPQDARVLVNKEHPLTPRGWAPDGLTRPQVATAGTHVRLRPVAAHALERLAAASRKATGKELVLVSGFRGADDQRTLYRRYVREHGRAAADTFSARAGHSEHQTGLAGDVTQDGTEYTRFGPTVTGRWVAANAWRFGFVVRYPRGESDVTGYEAEPWHLRYVGVGLAAHMHVAGVATLEKATGAGSATAYPR